MDVGCGTGIFTADLLTAGSRVTGLELSFPMLLHAGKKAAGLPFHMVQGDMRRLPFADGTFDKTVSVTAIEFLDDKDAREAVAAMFRVTRPGGLVVVASLNSLSPWAARRTAAAKQGHSLFAHARFRSPAEMSRPCAASCLHQDCSSLSEGRRSGRGEKERTGRRCPRAGDRGLSGRVLAKNLRHNEHTPDGYCGPASSLSNF